MVKTFYKRITIAATGLLLCACEMKNPFSEIPLLSSFRSESSIDVLGGWGKVRGPSKYCVSDDVSRPETGFVVFVPCYFTSKSESKPATEGLIMIQVGTEGSAIVTDKKEEILSYLKSDEGLNTLTGKRGLSAIGGQINNNIVEILLEEGLSTNASGFHPHEWRAFFDLNDRLVTIAIRSFANHPNSDTEALELLRVATSRVIN